MENLENKLSAILGNPQMMQQIMSMAQNFGQQQPEPAPEISAPPLDFDPAMVTRLMSLAGKACPDPEEKALLCALQPYLTQSRIQRLEKAMRAAKLAGAASMFLRTPAGG